MNAGQAGFTPRRTRPALGDWAADAACRWEGAPDMHPIDSVGVDEAIAFCRQCPVREVCLEHALVHNEEHGVWGGASERERKRMRRQRTLRAVAR